MITAIMVIIWPEHPSMHPFGNLTRPHVRILTLGYQWMPHAALATVWPNRQTPAIAVANNKATV